MMLHAFQKTFYCYFTYNISFISMIKIVESYKCHDNFSMLSFWKLIAETEIN